jgi:hypothetical protein
MVRNLWRADRDGELTAESGELSLVVRTVNGFARFLVLRPVMGVEPHPKALVASGTEEDVRSAMAAAERTAERLVAAARRQLRQPRYAA